MTHLRFTQAAGYHNYSMTRLRRNNIPIQAIVLNPNGHSSTGFWRRDMQRYRDHAVALERRRLHWLRTGDEGPWSATLNNAHQDARWERRRNMSRQESRRVRQSFREGRLRPLINRFRERYQDRQMAETINDYSNQRYLPPEIRDQIRSYM